MPALFCTSYFSSSFAASSLLCPFALPACPTLCMCRRGLIQRFFNLILCSLLVHVIYSFVCAPSLHLLQLALTALHAVFPKFKVFAAQFNAAVDVFVIVCTDFTSFVFVFIMSFFSFDFRPLSGHSLRVDFVFFYSSFFAGLTLHIQFTQKEQKLFALSACLFCSAGRFNYLT